MPEITVLGDFVIDPKYDAKKDVLDSVEQMRKELNNENVHFYFPLFDHFYIDIYKDHHLQKNRPVSSLR